MIAQMIFKILASDDFEYIENGEDMVDGAEVEFFGFLAMNAVASVGF
jgi:hypothetical protein